MAFDGAGTYSPPVSSFNPAVAATDIAPTDWNSLLTDIATALSTCVTKNGQTVITANIPLAGFKLTGLGAPTTANDALSYGNRIVGTGTTTNDSASAGQIGEWIESPVLRVAGINCTSTVALNITSVSLTAGDWDVVGNAGITVTGGTITQFSGGAGSTSATLPAIGLNGLAQVQAGISVTGDVNQPIAGRISLSATTTIYLIGSGVFSGTAVVYGFIGARRAR